MNFNIGDTVKVVKKVDFYDWISNMDTYIECYGEILSFYTYIGSIKHPGDIESAKVLFFEDGVVRYFPLESLELVGEN